MMISKNSERHRARAKMRSCMGAPLKILLLMRIHPSLQSFDDAHSINFQPSPLMDALFQKRSKFLEAACRKIPFMRPAASLCRARRRGSGRILRKITRRISNSNFPRSQWLQLPVSQVQIPLFALPQCAAFVFMGARAAAISSQAARWAAEVKRRARHLAIC